MITPSSYRIKVKIWRAVTNGASVIMCIYENTKYSWYCWVSNNRGGHDYFFRTFYYLHAIYLRHHDYFSESKSENARLLETARLFFHTKHTSYMIIRNCTIIVNYSEYWKSLIIVYTSQGLHCTIIRDSTRLLEIRKFGTLW